MQRTLSRARSHAFILIHGASVATLVHTRIHRHRLYESDGIFKLNQLTHAVKSNKMNGFKRPNQHFIGHLIVIRLFINEVRFQKKRRRKIRSKRNVNVLCCKHSLNLFVIELIKMHRMMAQWLIFLAAHASTIRVHSIRVHSTYGINYRIDDRWKFLSVKNLSVWNRWKKLMFRPISMHL